MIIIIDFIINFETNNLVLPKNKKPNGFYSNVLFNQKNV